MAQARLHTTIALCLLAGCRSYSQEDGEKLANQVYAMSTQLQALSKSQNDAQKLIERQNEQVAFLTEQVDELNRQARRSDADLGVQIDELMAEVARLKGIAEGAKERLDAMEAQLGRTQETQKIAGAQSEEEKEAAIEAAKQRERLLSQPAKVIDEAVKLINEQKLEDARNLLREFIARAKEMKKPANADVAQYLFAETFYLETKYQRAATEYNTVRKDYPKSPKVPDSLLKMGMCFEKLNLTEDAQLFYRTLTKQYPNSKASKQARDRLKELK